MNNADVVDDETTTSVFLRMDPPDRGQPPSPARSPTGTVRNKTNPEPPRSRQEPARPRVEADLSILDAPDDLRQMPSVLTSREVAHVLRVGIREVRLLVDSGQLAGARVGPRKVIRISKVALLALLKMRKAI